MSTDVSVPVARILIWQSPAIGGSLAQRTMIRSYAERPNTPDKWREGDRLYSEAYVKQLQAKIDALMLEYCPDEMTAEQLEEWARSQGIYRDEPAKAAPPPPEPVVHELKTDPEPFTASWFGNKDFEFRKNDRGFRLGDTVVLRETRYSSRSMAEDKAPLEYTGRTLVRKIVYILQGYGVNEGYVVLGLKETTPASKLS